MDFPKIAVGIVNTRPEMIDRCQQSLARQVYPPEITYPYIVDNTAKKMTIGEAFNTLVTGCEVDWILFVGDDDYLARTYLFNLGVYLRTAQERYEPVCITTHMILNDENERIPLEIHPTGMWKVDYLKEHPFDETLERWVDTDLFKRTAENGDTIMVDQTNFGYYYVQHDDNVSYNKFEKKTKILNKLQERETRKKNIIAEPV